MEPAANEPSEDEIPEGFDYAPTVAVATVVCDDPKEQKPHEGVVLLVVLTTFLNGLVLSFQPLFQRFEQHPRLFDMAVPFGIYHWSRSVSVAFGVALVCLAFNLFHRKKASWYIAVTGLTVSLVIHVLRALMEVHGGGDAQDALAGFSVFTCVLNLTLLLIYRSRFNVKSDPRNIKQGIIILALTLLVAIAYGVIGFSILARKDFGIEFQVQDALMRTLRLFLMIGNDDLTPHTRFAQWFLESLNLAGGISGAIAFFSLFRPIEYKLRTVPAEHALMSKVLDDSGKDALDNYKLLPDKSYIFSSNKQCAAAYRTALDVAINLGDLVGPIDQLPSFLRGFVSMCHRNGWKVAFMQVTDRNLQMYRDCGLSVLKIGEDAIVDLDKFAKETKDKKDFRSRNKKLEKEGYKLQKLSPPHTESLIAELKAISDEWLSLPGRRERTFSLGYFDKEQLKADTVFVLLAPDGSKLAFVNQVKSYAPGEVSIDMMRHKNEVPNGSMDYLFCKLLVALHDEGFKRFSLGLAAMSGVGETPDASMEEKAVHQIYEHMNRFFSYKGLRRYKSKFEPTWEGRYLVYEGGTPGLIRTTLAILRVAEPD